MYYTQHEHASVEDHEFKVLNLMILGFTNLNSRLQ